jgi:hypothetical protein
LANDRAFVEFAQGFAGRLAAEPGDDKERIRLAFRRALAREPSDTELAGLLEYLGAQRSEFAAAPQEASQVAPGGTAGTSAADAAAWTMVARVLLNLDEFVTRE